MSLHSNPFEILINEIDWAADNKTSFLLRLADATKVWPPWPHYGNNGTIMWLPLCLGLQCIKA